MSRGSASFEHQQESPDGTADQPIVIKEPEKKELKTESLIDVFGRFNDISQRIANIDFTSREHVPEKRQCINNHP